MLSRICSPLQDQSFFLFGARGTGKTTLLKEIYKTSEPFWINLLKPSVYELYQDTPEILSEQLILLRKKTGPNFWAVIDEVQKVPKLLEVVHYEIEENDQKFALTGSSARKLKRGAANLLAGRAHLNQLFPLTQTELGDSFDLKDALRWGLLPKVVNLSTETLKKSFLKTYVEMYLKEEILEEQIVRKIAPFKKFLNIAGQCSSKIINIQKIADEIKVDWTTVKTYFEILEDSLIGFFLPAFDKSIRKQQLKASKFYLFDIGVTRILNKSIDLPESGLITGPLFEQLVICEIFSLNSYLRADFSLSYFATHSGAEIDLVIERPGKKTLLVEIKFAQHVGNKELTKLADLVSETPDSEGICLCREQIARQVSKNVSVMPWQDGVREIFARVLKPS